VKTTIEGLEFSAATAAAEAARQEKLRTDDQQTNVASQPTNPEAPNVRTISICIVDLYHCALSSFDQCSMVLLTLWLRFLSLRFYDQRVQDADNERWEYVKRDMKKMVVLLAKKRYKGQSKLLSRILPRLEDVSEELLKEWYEKNVGNIPEDVWRHLESANGAANREDMIEEFKKTATYQSLKQGMKDRCESILKKLEPDTLCFLSDWEFAYSKKTFLGQLCEMILLAVEHFEDNVELRLLFLGLCANLLQDSSNGNASNTAYMKTIEAIASMINMSPKKVALMFTNLRSLYCIRRPTRKGKYGSEPGKNCLYAVEEGARCSVVKIGLLESLYHMTWKVISKGKPPPATYIVNGAGKNHKSWPGCLQRELVQRFDLNFVLVENSYHPSTFSAQLFVYFFPTQPKQVEDIVVIANLFIKHGVSTPEHCVEVLDSGAFKHIRGKDVMIENGELKAISVELKHHYNAIENAVKPDTLLSTIKAAKFAGCPQVEIERAMARGLKYRCVSLLDEAIAKSLTERDAADALLERAFEAGAPRDAFKLIYWFAQSLEASAAQSDANGTSWATWDLALEESTSAYDETDEIDLDLVRCVLLAQRTHTFNDVSHRVYFCSRFLTLSCSA